MLNTESGFQDTKIYVPTEKFNEDGSVASTVKGFAVVTVRANTYEIYKNWEELSKF